MHTTKPWITRNAKWLALVACLAVFLLLLQAVWSGDPLQWDRAVKYFISESLPSGVALPLALGVSRLAGPVAMIAFAVAFFLLVRNKRLGASMGLNLALIALINLVLKHIVQRPRPEWPWLTNAAGYSFPSWHAMAALACYGYLIYLIFRYAKNRKLRVILIGALSLLIALVGLSRIYLGVHYASDVLAGFLLSLSFLIVYTSVMKRFLPAGRCQASECRDLA